MKKTHKYIGLLLIPFLAWMSISGIILNHRKTFNTFELSRKWLPDDYLYRNWNYGFFKGGFPISPDSLLMYGNEGIWLSDRKTKLQECNQGIDTGADRRKILRITSTKNGKIYAVSTYKLYECEKKNNTIYWIPVTLPDKIDCITDLETKGDTLVILTRSEYLLTTTEEKNTPVFTRYVLPDSPDLGGKRSFFRFIWKLHSGELFGLPGKLFVDGIGLIFLFLGITGIFVWYLPKQIQKRKKQHTDTTNQIKWFRRNFQWHDKTGYWLIIPLVLLSLTGAFLRPPLLLLIARSQITPPRFTTMNGVNPWHDLLRTLRYDKVTQDWILYTTEGLFCIKELGTSSIIHNTPQRISNPPPISVMGINVLEAIGEDKWLIGSFSGLILWNRETGSSLDALTGHPPIPMRLPFGRQQISGLIFYNANQTVLFDYNTGAQVIEPKQTFVEMPADYAKRPMSFRAIALEMHTGRLFTSLGIWNILYVFVIGVMTILVLLSGWKISKQKLFRNKRKNKHT